MSRNDIVAHVAAKRAARIAAGHARMTQDRARIVAEISESAPTGLDMLINHLIQGSSRKADQDDDIQTPASPLRFPPRVGLLTKKLTRVTLMMASLRVVGVISRAN